MSCPHLYPSLYSYRGDEWTVRAGSPALTPNYRYISEMRKGGPKLQIHFGNEKRLNGLFKVVQEVSSRVGT